MALAYLLSPTFQVENSAGKPATGGWIETFISGSRDPYYCYSDFQGTLHPFKIPLDSLGSNVVLADDGQAYDVYVYNRYGSLLMSRYNVKPGHGAGGGGGTITSSDGSIDVTMTPTGYDLKVNGQEASVLRAGANDLTSDGQFVFYELVRDGDHVTVDTNGKIRLEDGWYHYDVTARVKWEDGVTVANTENHVQLYTTLNSDIIPFDCSYEHEDTLHLHGQVKIATSGSQFVVGVQGIETGMSIELVDCGLFAITGHGDAAEYEAGTGIIIDDHEISVDPSVVQEKLTAGTGIIIDDNEVSVDTTVIQEKLEAGDNIVIEGNTISATAEPQQQADWTETDSSSVTYIQHKPQNLVQDPDYVHTDNNFTDADKTKLDGIEAGAEANVQSDWNETNTSSDAYIQNKPDLSVYATDAELSAGLATKQDTLTAGDNITITNNVIAATAAPQEQSDWAETDTADVSYIKNKPGVKPVVAGNNITITEGNDSFTISATADPQVQADWAQTDSTAVDYIQNKPTIPSGTQLVPAATSADANKVLTVDSQGVPGWAAGGGGGTYTAGDGISIDENDEISAKLGDGLEIGTSLSPVTNTARAIGYSDPDTGVTVMQMLNGELATAIETTGLTFTVQNLTDNNNVSQPWIYGGVTSLKLYPAIFATASYSLGHITDPRMRLVLSTTGIDVASSSGTIPAGTQFTYNLDDVNTSLSTITWETISDQPEHYSLGVTWQASWGDWSCLVATGRYTKNAPYDSGTLSYQTATLGAIAVSNPLPASAVGDAGKILTVNAQGAAAWGMLGSVQSIQQVNALPANPDANTLYLIPEA